MPARRSARNEVAEEPPKRVSKRAASPPPAPAPLKRTKSETNRSAQSKAKPASKPAPKPTSKPPPKGPAPALVSRVIKPYLNPLPTAPASSRPANQIFVWGAGNFGQFGMGPDHLGEFDKPKKNTWIEKKMEEGMFGGDGAGIESVAAGGLHTMFVDEKGAIWTCGVNDDAALGRMTKDVPDPDHKGSFMNVDILTSIPHPLQSLVDDNFRAVSIAAGDSICAAISSTGELRVWGSFRANEGALGFSDGSKMQFLPSPILRLPTREAEKTVAVAAGNNHLVVLTTHGHIYTWGAGEQGQLGRKILERRKIHGTTPEKVTLSARGRKAVLVGAGNYSSFAVDDSGDVWGWGLNSMGQAGTGLDVEEEDSVIMQPRRVIGLSKDDLSGATVVQIVGGEHHTLFRTSDGRVFACGRANGGQIGIPVGHEALRDGCVREPTLVPIPDHASDPVVHVSAGTHNNLAVTQAGALFAWGEGNQGELGIGDETEARKPTMIVRREGGSWQAIAAACGGQHSLGLFRKKVSS